MGVSVLCSGCLRSVLKWPDNGPIIEALTELAERHRRFGFRNLFGLLRKAGHPWNHKRVWRLYCDMALNIRRRFKRSYKSETPEMLARPIRLNQARSADFTSDALMDGRCFRTFNVIDDYNREALQVEIGVSLTAQRVTRVMDQILLGRGAPERIRVDHGPEFRSATFFAWCEQRNIVIEYAQSGKPTQNAFVERFNGIYRDAVLDAWGFMNLSQVQEETERRLKECNTVRPHESLGDVSPIEFLTGRGHGGVSSYDWS